MQAREVFAPKEIGILYDCLRHAKIIRAPPAKPPDIRIFVVGLARLTGFHPTKRQPLPGSQKMW